MKRLMKLTGCFWSSDWKRLKTTVMKNASKSAFYHKARKEPQNIWKIPEKKYFDIRIWGENQQPRCLQATCQDTNNNCDLNPGLCLQAHYYHPSPAKWNVRKYNKIIEHPQMDLVWYGLAFIPHWICSWCKLAASAQHWTRGDAW